MTELAQKINVALRDATKPLTVKELAKVVGCSCATARRYAEQLTDVGFVEADDKWITYFVRKGVKRRQVDRLCVAYGTEDVWDVA